MHLLAWGVEDDAALRCTERLLQAGANPNILNIYGQSSLHAAVWERRTPHAFLGLLLDAGADVDIRARGIDTPLHQAILAGSVDNVRFLIDRGANIEARDEAGRTGLLKAVKQNQTQVTRLLLKRGARVGAISARREYGPETILHIAARFADCETLQVLREHADLKALDPEMLDGRNLSPVDCLEEMVKSGTVPRHLAVKRREALEQLLIACTDAKTQ